MEAPVNSAPLILSELAKRGDVDAIAEIVGACWREHPHLTAKQVVMTIRNASKGQLSQELVRDAVLRYLGMDKGPVPLAEDVPEGETSEDGEDATDNEEEE